jgi:hypothetical protein
MGSEQQKQGKQKAEQRLNSLSTPRLPKKPRQTPPPTQVSAMPQHSPRQHQQQQRQQQVPSGFNQLLGAVEYVASRDMSRGEVHPPHSHVQQEAFIDPMLETYNVGRSPMANTHPRQDLMQQHHSPSIPEFDIAPLPEYTSSHHPTTPPRPTQQPLLPCSCLADHYLITSRLQTAESATPDIDFTTSLSSRLHTHRDALQTAYSILECRHCSRSFMAGAHNVMMVVGLLTSIALSYKKLIEDIKAEAKRASSANEVKRFTISEGAGEPARPSEHGTSSVDIALTASEWQTLMLSTIRKDIYPIARAQQMRYSDGSTADNHSCQSPDTLDNHSRQPPDTLDNLTLSELIGAMEDRQRNNHRACPNPYVNDQNPHNHHEEDYNCLRMVKHVRSVMHDLDV